MQQMQKELDGLIMWSNKNARPLNVNKCASITLTRKKNPIQTKYHIKGEESQSVNEVRDLGGISTSQLEIRKAIPAGNFQS